MTPETLCKVFENLIASATPEDKLIISRGYEQIKKRLAAGEDASAIAREVLEDATKEIQRRASLN
jgi:hypothetical protein